MTEQTPQTSRVHFIDDPKRNPSAAVWSTPTFFPTANLFNPVMVTINVIEADSKHPLLRRCITKAFIEAGTREIELKDVSSWLLRVLISWLYTGRVFLEDESGHRDESAGTRKRKSEDLEKDVEEGGQDLASLGRADTSLSRLTGLTGYDPSPSAMVMKDRWQGYGYRLVTGRSWRCNNANPVSWPWEWLLRLYAFTDQYDTRELRMLVLELMQLKMYTIRPFHYARPSKQDFQLLDELLHPTSGPYRLFVDVFANDQPLSRYGIIRTSQKRVLDGLPYQFLLESVVAAKAHAGALKCRTECKPCIDPADHRPYDVDNIHWQCATYHEHGSNQAESSRCASKWNKLWRDYCTGEEIPLLGQDNSSANTSS